jgi:hypothetical protein
VVLLLVGGCVGTDVGNPERDDDSITEVRMAALESEPESTSSSTQREVYSPTPRGLQLRSGLEIDEAWITVGSVLMRGGDSCVKRNESVVEGPFVIDLLEQRAFPSFPQLDTRSGEFCQVRIVADARRQGTLPDDAPEKLRGASLLVVGRRVDGTPFELVVEDEQELIFVGRDTPIVVETGDNVFFSTFSLATWFEELALDELDAEQTAEGPVVTIDLERTPPTYNHFLRNFRQSALLYRGRKGEETFEKGAGRRPVAEIDNVR